MAKIVTITNPLTGQPAQVDQLEHTAQQIDDAAKRALEYGLGGGTTIPEPNDANTCLNTGWYAISSMANCPFTYGILRVEKWYRNAIWQTAYQLGTGVIARRQYIGGSTWKDWEYDNPPMKLGVEYQTTERIGEKPVYKKLVKLGSLPSNTTERFLYTNDTTARCIEVCAQVGYFAYAGGWCFTLPTVEFPYVVGDLNGIKITSNKTVDNSITDHPVTAIVKYIKV